MKKVHPILALSEIYQPSVADPASEGRSYNVKDGYWKLSNGEVLMRSTVTPKPTTKKADIETGEDQKHE